MVTLRLHAIFGVFTKCLRSILREIGERMRCVAECNTTFRGDIGYKRMLGVRCVEAVEYIRLVCNCAWVRRSIGVASNVHRVASFIKDSRGDTHTLQGSICR